MVTALLTNHAQVLLWVAAHGQMPVREVAASLALGKRTVLRILADLEHAGYLTKRRTGRSNQYVIHGEQPVWIQALPNVTVNDLLRVRPR